MAEGLGYGRDISTSSALSQRPAHGNRTEGLHIKSAGSEVSFRSKKFQDIFEKCVDEMGQFLFKDYRAEPIA